ncbi:hypothetical protein COP2_030714 [Malus domestica]
MIYIIQLVEVGLTLSKQSLEPSLLTLQLLILLEQTSTNPLQLIHFFLQIVFDLQSTLEFQHLRLKLINNLLEVDHLNVSSYQFFILCINSRVEYRDGTLKILNLGYVTLDLLICTFILHLDRLKPSFQIHDFLVSGLKLQRNKGKDIRPLQSSKLKFQFLDISAKE